MYLIVWSEGDEDNLTDIWETAETLDDAKLRYKEILAMDGIYVLSIAKVVKSTDYQVHAM